LHVQYTGGVPTIHLSSSGPSYVKPIEQVAEILQWIADAAYGASLLPLSEKVQNLNRTLMGIEEFERQPEIQQDLDPGWDDQSDLGKGIVAEELMEIIQFIEEAKEIDSESGTCLLKLGAIDTTNLLTKLQEVRALVIAQEQEEDEIALGLIESTYGPDYVSPITQIEEILKWAKECEEEIQGTRDAISLVPLCEKIEKLQETLKKIDEFPFASQPVMSGLRDEEPEDVEASRIYTELSPPNLYRCKAHGGRVNQNDLTRSMVYSGELEHFTNPEKPEVRKSRPAIITLNNVTDKNILFNLLADKSSEGIGIQVERQNKDLMDFEGIREGLVPDNTFLISMVEIYPDEIGANTIDNITMGFCDNEVDENLMPLIFHQAENEPFFRSRPSFWLSKEKPLWFSVPPGVCRVKLYPGAKKKTEERENI
jgi:hypothetical protein